MPRAPPEAFEPEVGLFIQTEQTPNPSTLKFLPGRVVMEKGTADFANVGAATPSPLAKRLFAVEGVERVFFGSDFVTVTKAADRDWQIMKPSILGGIMEHYTSGDPVIADQDAAATVAADDDEVVAQIKELLDTRVRPAVAQDGGDIVFHDFRDGIVYLHGMPATVTMAQYLSYRYMEWASKQAELEFEGRSRSHHLRQHAIGALNVRLN